MRSALLLITLFSLSCTNVYKVTSVSKDEQINWSNYKTFAWLHDDTDTASSPYNNQIIRNNIRNYYGLCLSDRGLKFDPDSPDILLQLVITTARQKKDFYEYAPSTYYRPYYYGSHYYNPYRFNYYYLNGVYYDFYYGSGDRLTKQTIDYVKGAISLNVVDRVNKKLIWSATAEGDIYDASVIKKNLHPAVHRIINELPLKPMVKRKHNIK
ncbi:MAG: hypothetical protein BGO69_08905 [Bacteroidetes bacterium 46-16]|nr:MAG: hypothetical protein BGO69_08905 [Bacteroidetes bacterium 46-16]